MKFYEINLQSVPKIMFACRVSVDHYKNQFHRIENFLEIVINMGGDIHIDHADGSREIYQEGMVTPVLQGSDCKMYAEAGTRQSHITVGVSASYRYTLHDTENMDYLSVLNRVKNENAILLPHLFALNDYFHDCITMIDHIICNNAVTDYKCSAMAIADWFFFVSQLTDIVLREIQKKQKGISPYSFRYADLARQYILDHYACQLSVGEVAEHIGISEGYLQLIFHQHFNMSVTEYINYHKIQLAKQYIHGKGLSLKEISFQLGIEDPSYMSRLFKKIEGISYRQYCKTKIVTDIS